MHAKSNSRSLVLSELQSAPVGPRGDGLRWLLLSNASEERHDA